MNQLIVPQEQVQPLMVQALWVSQAISILTTIAMLAYFGAEILKVGVGAFKEIKK